MGCKHTLLALVKLLVNQHPQVLLLRATLYPCSTQPAFVLEIVLMYRTLPLTLMPRPTCQACRGPLDVIPLLQHVGHTTQWVLSANLLRVHSIPLSRLPSGHGKYFPLSMSCTDGAEELKGTCTLQITSVLHSVAIHCLESCKIMEKIPIPYPSCGVLMEILCILIIVYCRSVYIQVGMQEGTSNKSHNAKTELWKSLIRPINLHYIISVRMLKNRLNNHNI